MADFAASQRSAILARKRISPGLLSFSISTGTASSSCPRTSTGCGASRYLLARLTTRTGRRLTPPHSRLSFNRKDAKHGRHIRPLIRLLKYWNVANNYVFDSFVLERAVIEHSFSWVAPNLQARLFSVIEALRTSGLSQAKRASVEEAREVVGRVEFLAANGFPEYAEIEVARLIPQLK